MVQGLHSKIFHVAAICIVGSSSNTFGADTGEVGDLSGAIGIKLEAGSPLVEGSSQGPFYKVVSAGLKSEAAFRGQIASVTDNNLTFDTLPDLLDPTKEAFPFVTGMFSTTRARATAEVSDGKVTSIFIDSNGSGYVKPPEIRIHPPDTGTNASVDAIDAIAVAEVNGSKVTVITVTNGGKGYSYAPRVEIEGGPHFLRLVEEGPNEGRFFLITSNSGDRVTLANSLNLDLSTISEILKPDALVEITPAWTLGSLFGYGPPFLKLKVGNETTADRVYLGETNSTNYQAYFHDGTAWRRKGALAEDESDTIVYPDEAFILAHHNAPAVDLVFEGVALTVNSFAYLPDFNDTFLMNNPFGADMMLSDLIAAENITTDLNDTERWYAHSSDEEADNVEILQNGVWTTYWHDGTNKDVTVPAQATAKPGSGIAGSLTSKDISLASGSISMITNPHVGQNIVVSTLLPHGLRNGFLVSISGVMGRKTDSASPKNQVDENGTIAGPDSGLIIKSAANGSYEITNVTPSSFELKGKSGNSDYKYETGNWSTGTGGSGYASNAYALFVGGGGYGAKGLATVSGGAVVGITLTDGGVGYLAAPKVIINSGGWRRVGAGNSPINDSLVPAGAGILLRRNHPNGTISRLRIGNPIK
jgi:hypothetical protein